MIVLLVKCLMKQHWLVADECVNEVREADWH